MRVTVVNVNGTMHVHAEGCADLNRKMYRAELSGTWTIETLDRKTVVEDSFGPAAGSFYAESGLPEGDPDNWREFVSTFSFAPCISLPDVAQERAAMETINGHEIGTSDKGNGKWSATCGTCAQPLTGRGGVTAANLETRIAAHTEEPPVPSAQHGPQEAASEPQSPEIPSVLSGVRSATAEDLEATRPRRGRRGKTRGVTVRQAEPRPLVPTPRQPGGKVLLSREGADNIKHLAAHAATESARRFWTRYLRERVEVAQ